jgi:hypothetical protein
VASFHFFERFWPPRRDKAPAHSLKPALAVLVEYRVDCRGGADVEAGARVYRRLVERQPVQGDDFFPGQLVGGTPAHDRQHIALLDDFASLRLRLSEISVTENFIGEYSGNRRVSEWRRQSSIKARPDIAIITWPKTQQKMCPRGNTLIEINRTRVNILVALQL